MDLFRGYKQGTETKDIISPTSHLTIDILLNKTKEAMGNNFLLIKQVQTIGKHLFIQYLK